MSNAVPASKLKLYYHPVSGHAHRAQLALSLMDARLALMPFLIGVNASLADIAGYSYIAAAPEGNVDLAPYANVRAWLRRVEALSGFAAFKKNPVGLAA